MKVKGLLIIFLTLVSFFLSLTFIVFATPVLFNPIPENNSYVPGGDRTLYINITEENLNTSTVNLNIIEKSAYDRGEAWDVYLMPCSNSTPSSWTCSKTISLAIVGSDTVEYFYFTANDTSGSIGFNGTRDSPLRFTLDRNLPDITFVNPTNESWVSGTLNITLDVEDVSSGVNDSIVMYSFDNSTWLNTTKDNYYKAAWNTSTLGNNQTVTIYTKASDKIGNTGYEKINVTVDNEYPSISILQPSQNQTVNGIISLRINAKDNYSGINNSTVSYKVGTITRTMDCSGTKYNYTCDEYFDTKLVSDGLRTINFSVSDDAGNTNSSSISVNVDNTVLSVSIINPANNAYIRGINYVNATVSDPTKLQGAKLKIGESWYNMTCANNKCYYLWNTSGIVEGTYTLFVNVTSSLNYLVNSSISVTVDGTKPNITIDSPVEEKVNGTIYPRAIVTDTYGVYPNATKFNISSHSSGMSCSKFVEGKRYVCGGNFNTTFLTDGYYTLYFYAEDLAGNNNSMSKTLLVQNGIITPTTTTTILPSQTTTTLPTNETVGEEGAVTLIEVISNFFTPSKSPYTPLIISIVLAVSIASVYTLRSLPRKVIKIKKKTFNVEDFFNKEQTALHFIYNYLLGITSGTADTTRYLKSALAFLEKMDKKSIVKEEMEKSLENLKQKDKLRDFVEKFKETYSDDGRIREKYIGKINKLLSGALNEKDEGKIKEIAKEAEQVCLDFKSFSEKELSLYREYKKSFKG